MTSKARKVPPYAAHWDAETYMHWVKMWNANSYPTFELETAEDAAALFMIAAVEANKRESQQLTYNDGRINMPPCVDLIQSRPDLAVPGMDRALTQLFNLESHGANAFSNLAQMIRMKPHTPWTPQTYLKFWELLSDVPVEKLVDFKSGYQRGPAPLTQAAHFIGLATDLYLLDRCPNDAAVKGALAQHWRRYFPALKSTMRKGRSYVGYAAQGFERHAPADDMAAIGPHIRNILRLIPKKDPNYDLHVRLMPRICGSIAPV